ncbi:MAG TPA: autotransporter-associated beta strand repeat-containing protein [Pirellulales bacterium]|jgi:autotransporter-associated beta strand protein|nr:autotransporter-associated beta strand repeat-containing protein [Pirellulales bacterium]
MIRFIALRGPRKIGALIFAVMLAATIPAVAADTFDFAAVYSDGFGYDWGYINDPVAGAITTNWVGPGNRRFPGDGAIKGDIANITTPTNGLLIELYYHFVGFQTESQQPQDFTLGVLNLNAGPTGYYDIDSYPSYLNYLIFDNNGSTAQINIIGNDAGNDVISSGVKIVSALDITGGKLLIAGPVVGGQLIVDASSLTLFGTNTHSSTVLHSGTLNVSQNANLGAATGSIDFQGGTLHPTANINATQSLGVESAGGTVSTSGLLTFAGPVVSAAGTLHMVGGGTLELATSSAYGGGLTVDSSTLLISNNIALAGTSGTLALNSSILHTTASFSTNTHITLSGSSTFEVGHATTLTAVGPIDGGGGLVQDGDDGTLVLGNNNSFTGGVTVNAGTLRVVGDNGLGDPSNSILINAATLNAAGSFTTNRGFLIHGALIDVDNAQTLTINSQVEGDAFGRGEIEGIALYKTGGGTLRLSHANSFSSPSTGFGIEVEAGDVSVSADNALGNAANSLAFNGGGLTVTAGFTTFRPVFLGVSGGTFSIGGLSSTLTASGKFTGLGMLTKAGSGTLVLTNGGNNYDGGTDIVDGTLRIGADAMLGTASRTLTFDFAGSPVLNTTADIAMSRPINLNNPSATFDVNAGTTLTVSGVIGGPGGFVKVGFGNLVLTGANSYTGPTMIKAGTLQTSVANTTSPGSAINLAGVAMFDLGGFSQSIGSLTGAGNVTTTGVSGFDTLTIGNDGASPVPFSGVISDAPAGRMLAITKVGSGTLTLSGANTYTGATTVNAGTLAVSGSIAAVSAVTVSAGATFDISDPTDVTVGSIAGAGNYRLGGETLTFGGLGTDTVVSGLIGDGGIGGGTGGSIVKLGTGNTTFSGITSYTGTTAVDFGMLTVSGTVFASSATTVAAGATMSFVNGANAGSGTITNSGSATSATSGGRTLLSGIGTTAGSALFMNNGGASSGGNGGQTVFNSGATGGTATITANGGAVAGALGGTTIFNDGSIIGAATLVTNGGANGGAGGLTETIGNVTGGNSRVVTNSGGTFDISQLTVSGLAVGSIEGAGNYFLGSKMLTFGNLATNTEVSGPIAGSGIGGGIGGSIFKVGGGATTLSGVNMYTGGTTLSQGGLNINNTNAIGSGTFAISDGTTIDNTSAGAIALATNNVQLWGGRFTFTGTQSLNFGTGMVALNANPTVTVSANTLTVGVIGNGTGNSLVKAGAGTLVVFGGASYTGTTAVNAGTLTIDSGPFASSASTVAAAAVMNFARGANAGSGTFANTNSTVAAVAGGLIQFSDTGTTAGQGVYTNFGGAGVSTTSNTGGNGGQIIFNSGATAGNATIATRGATLLFAASGSQTLFNNGSSAGNATITTGGGVDGRNGGPVPGGLTLFSGNATAGAATLITNAGSLGGLPGFTEFEDTSNGGTANITINTLTINEFVNFASAGGATIATHGIYSGLYFEDNATAGTAIVTTNVDGLTEFRNSSTAGNATIITANGNGSISGAVTRFHDSSDAGHAHFTTMGQSPTAGNTGSTLFYDSSSAANGIFTTNGGMGDHGAAGLVQFRNNSTAASGTFTNLGGSDVGASNVGENGGEIDFYDSSNAGTTATIVNGGATGGFGASGGITQFFNASKAGTVAITNNSANDNNNRGVGGRTYFNSGASADHATITNNGGIFDNYNGPLQGGNTVFYGGSTADHATLTTSGALIAGGLGGEIDFNSGSDMASATITNNGSAVSGAAGGLTNINGSGASTDTAKFINNGGTVSGASGGKTYITSSTAGNDTFTNNGGTVSGTGGGETDFDGTDTAAAATLISNGGSNGGAGGGTYFISEGGNTPSGGTARVIANAGGILDISGTPFVTVGSIEGAGTYQLGAATLTSGSLNTDTTISGVIANGGYYGGSNGSLTKEGTGKLSLTGANTYTGPTTVNGGTLQSANNGALATTSSVAVNNAGSMLAVNYGGNTDYTQTQVAALLGKTTFGAPSTGFGFDTTNASGAVTYTNGIAIPAGVAKLGPGTLILSGAKTYTGGTTVLAGTLKFNIASGAATVAAGATATVASGATLELAGSVSALGSAGGNRVHIVNNSTTSGVVVSGTNQVVGGIDGLGNVQVSAGSDLTADHIAQNSLVIGGTMNSPGMVTIDASDSSGNPLDAALGGLSADGTRSVSTTLSRGIAFADSLQPTAPFASGAPSSSNLDPPSAEGFSGDPIPAGPGADPIGGNPTGVPEPSSIALCLMAMGGGVLCRRRMIRRKGSVNFAISRTD